MLHDRVEAATSIAPNAGRYYGDILRDIHAWLSPRNYVEIGVNKGSVIRYASCDTIGVDPQFLIDTNIIGKKSSCLLYQTISDDFFAKRDPRMLFGGPVHLAFLDGLHEYECLLRDFINIEKSMDRRSMVVMHDCIPSDIYMARRRQFDEEIRKLTPTPASWTGDIWKTVLILKKYRSDLTIVSIDSAPTGLVFIGNLNPDSKVLEKKYKDSVEEMRSATLQEYGIERYAAGLNVQPADLLNTSDKMKAMFPWF